MPRIASHSRKLGRGRKDCPQQVSQGAWPSSYLDVRLLASRTVTLQECVVSSYSVCGTLVCSPRKPIPAVIKAKKKGNWKPKERKKSSFVGLVY